MHEAAPNPSGPPLHSRHVGEAMLDTPPVSHLSQVISQAITPAFILVAVAGNLEMFGGKLQAALAITPRPRRPHDASISRTP